MYIKAGTRTVTDIANKDIRVRASHEHWDKESSFHMWVLLVSEHAVLDCMSNGGQRRAKFIALYILIILDKVACRTEPPGLSKPGKCRVRMEGLEITYKCLVPSAPIRGRIPFSHRLALCAPDWRWVAAKGRSHDRRRRGIPASAQWRPPRWKSFGQTEISATGIERCSSCEHQGPCLNR